MSSDGAQSLRTPREMLEAQGKLTPETVAVRVDGRVVDLHTPVDGDAQVEPVGLGDPAALPIIRHSTAHVMADAVQRLYPGTKVTFGPAIEEKCQPPSVTVTHGRRWRIPKLILFQCRRA